MRTRDRFIHLYAIGVTLLLGVLTLGGFAQPAENVRVRELTVERIHVVDASGRARVEIAGSFPPRRTALAGLLFVNNDGGEAGGLVYRGRQEGGRVSAGGSLTMDQYNEDQVVALQYSQDGNRRQRRRMKQTHSEQRPESTSRQIAQGHGSGEGDTNKQHEAQSADQVADTARERRCQQSNRGARAEHEAELLGRQTLLAQKTR